MRRLEIQDQVIVLDKVKEIEEYLQAADLNLVTSESESFCLSILEAMCFGCPSVAMRVGGIPEVIDDNRSGQLVPFGEVARIRRSGRGTYSRRATAIGARPSWQSDRPGAILSRKDRAEI